MKKINLAIIGYGGMGSYHGDLVSTLENYHITGIYDIDGARYEVAKEKGIETAYAFTSKEAVAADKNTDTVLIATPNDMHLPYVKYFAQAGKNIICEKPVALSSDEYAEMLEITRKCGVTFMVHQNRRWDKDFLIVKRIYEENTVGKLWRVESRVQGANGIPGDWRKFKETGGGMMLDWGVHLIDQFVYMIGELPESVYADFSYDLGFEVDDAFKLQLRYKNGLRAEITVDTNCFCPLPRWMVYGENGTAVVKNWELEGEIVKPVYAKDLKIAGITAGNGFTRTMAYRSAESVVRQPLPQVSVEDRPFYKEFYDVAVGGKEPMIKSDQVMAVMKIMEAAKRSSDTGEVVKVKY